MSKNIMICFRTSEELRDAMEVIAKEERRSVSSTIEKILYKHLEERKDYKPVQQENRRYPRKMITAPALITEFGSENASPQVGIVVDISLDGLQISIPDNYQYDIREDREASRISIVFTLPDYKRPITMQCMPKRTYPSGGETRIGASIVDTDFASYQAGHPELPGALICVGLKAIFQRKVFRMLLTKGKITCK
jgi:hypothetical protein